MQEIFRQFDEVLAESDLTKKPVLSPYLLAECQSRYHRDQRGLGRLPG